MRLPFGILATLLLLSGPVQARIGETEEQVRAHYGKPVALLASHDADSGVTKCYTSNGYLIAVTYLENESVREIVTKADNSKITQGELRKLLGTRASGATWNLQELGETSSETVGIQQWRSTDERARVAIYDSKTRTLFLTTQHYIDQTNAATRRSRAQAALSAAEKRTRALSRPNIMEGGSAIRSLRLEQNKPAASPAIPAK
ncbi:MAG: hypothetical protein ABI540_01510 [Spartobacteria bacterium]